MSAAHSSRPSWWSSWPLPGKAGSSSPSCPSSPSAASAPRRFSPEEGWSVVALVTILGLVVATAIDEPAWVNGRGLLTDCLAWCAVAGTLVGFIGPKVGWGRWRTHAIGALYAGILVPVIAGWAVLPGTSMAQAFRFTAEYRMLIYGAVLLILIRFRPQGLLGTE